jgi:hypothetical protein
LQVFNCAIKWREVGCPKELALLRIREHLNGVKLLRDR